MSVVAGMKFPEPKQAEKAFYEAFIDRDLNAMRQVWSPDPDIACIHPGGGLLIGIEAIMASWREIFHDTSAPQLSVRPVQIRLDNDTAIHIVEEKIRSGDQGRQATVIATNVFQRDTNGWLMRLHHASLPLVEPIESPPQVPLH